MSTQYLIDDREFNTPLYSAADIRKEYDEALHPRDEVGRWTNSGGGGLASLHDRIAKPDGGFSYNPVTGTEPKTGFALSIHPEREHVLAVKDVTVAALAEYATKNWDLLTQSGNYFGAWHDPESGKVFLDISTVVNDRAEAERLGREHKQLAYFDLEAGRSHQIGGGKAVQIGIGPQKQGLAEHGYNKDLHEHQAGHDGNSNRQAHLTSRRSGKGRSYALRFALAVPPPNGARAYYDGYRASERDFVARYGLVVPKEFREEEHPRDESGRWTDGGGEDGGKPVASAEEQAADAKALDTDPPITLGSTSSRERAHDERIPSNVRDEAWRQYVEERIDNDDNYHEIYGAIRADFIENLNGDNEAVGDETARIIAERVTFTEEAELFGETLTFKLDPDSIVYGDASSSTLERHSEAVIPDLDLDALRTVSGRELTDAQKAEVAREWASEFEKQFDLALEESLSSDEFYDRQHEAQLNLWRDQFDRLDLSDTEFRELDAISEWLGNKEPDDDETETSSSSATGWQQIDKKLGVNAEGLTRSLVRGYQNEMPNTKEVAVKASWVGDHLAVLTNGLVKTKDGSFQRFEINREFHRNPDGTLGVYHALFKLPKGAQAGGIATRVLASSIDLYDRYRVSQIDVNANIDVGAYAWARLGFQSVGRSFHNILVGGGFTEEMRKAADKAGADAPYVVSQMPGAHNLLLNRSWHGRMLLQGAQGQAFRHRVFESKKLKPKKGKGRSRHAR